jgi:Transport and Golgi organisation 2
MCTAVVSVGTSTVLVAGVRDEFVSRAWQPPGRHWPEHPELVGGRDLVAGGTWLAVAPGARRVACVLNARGRMAPPGTRRSRGVLPLQAAAGERLNRAGLADFDPFHLLTAEPGWAALSSWDGERLTERELPAGLHVIVNSGLGADLLAAAAAGAGASPGRPEREIHANDHEAARAAYFLPRLRAVPPPDPLPGSPVAQAWGGWLPLLNGDGIGPADPRALIVRRDLGDGRVWGTTSISLVALSPHGVRYDFTGKPGDPASWYPVTP